VINLNRLHEVALGIRNERGCGKTTFDISCIQGSFDLDNTLVIVLVNKYSDVSVYISKIVSYFGENVVYHKFKKIAYLRYNKVKRQIIFKVLNLNAGDFNLSSVLDGFSKNIPIVDFRYIEYPSYQKLKEYTDCRKNMSFLNG